MRLVGGDVRQHGSGDAAVFVLAGFFQQSRVGAHAVVAGDDHQRAVRLLPDHNGVEQVVGPDALDQLQQLVVGERRVKVPVGRGRGELVQRHFLQPPCAGQIGHQRGERHRTGSRGDDGPFF